MLVIFMGSMGTHSGGFQDCQLRAYRAQGQMVDTDRGKHPEKHISKSANPWRSKSQSQVTWKCDKSQQVILSMDNAALPTLRHRACNHGRADGVPGEQSGRHRCQECWQSIAIDMLVADRGHRVEHLEDKCLRLACVGQHAWHHC